jgi:hypothetical protein
VTINNSMPSINNFLKGFQDGLPGMKDYQHASRLYIDNNFKLMPKQKFLFHVVFNTDETLFVDGFNANERYELNMLVKACDLPKYNMSMEEKTQYNKKMYTATRIAYEPVNITFHDDHADTVNAFWKKYYEYNIADSIGMNNDLTISNTKDDYYDFGDARATTKFGLDTPKQSKKPYLKGIEIFVLHKQRFTSMTLVNPVIGSFSHDSLDQADGAGVMNNTMQILYETVIYKAGIVNKNNVPGFATVHYDNSPSPLSVLGGGTNSIFGPGGIVDGIGSVIRDVQSGNILGAILGASNTYNNAKKIKKKDVKEELKGIAKDGVLEVGKQAGTITNPIGQFSVGAAVAGAAIIASSKGTNDNKNNSDTRIITNAVLDTVNYLGTTEAINLVTTDPVIKTEIAAYLYWRDIGSRTGKTRAESDVEYAGSSATTKTVYENKAITNTGKLVTEGYIKINRSSQNVEIATEKVGLQ